MEDNKIELGNPGPAMTWIFTMLTMLFALWFAGIWSGSLPLAVGVIQLACFPAYLVGAIVFLKKGDSLSGIVFLVFATLFGGIGGILNVIAHFDTVFNWGIDPAVGGIPFLWGGIVMIPVCIALRRIPVLILAVYFMVSPFLIVYALVVLGVLGYGVLVACKWMGLFIAIGGLYVCCADIIRIGGDKGLPCGPSIFK